LGVSFLTYDFNYVSFIEPTIAPTAEAYGFNLTLIIPVTKSVGMTVQQLAGLLEG
jgi:hypothetical protein